MAYATAMSKLETQLQALTSGFVASVVGALRSAAIDEIIGMNGSSEAKRARAASKAAPAKPSAPKAVRPQRRHRSSAAEVAGHKTLAYETARTLKDGFSKGDVMRKSGSRVDLGRALTLLVADGKLRKQGERRLTRYWVK